MLFGSAKMAIPVDLCRPQQIQQAHVGGLPWLPPWRCAHVEKAGGRLKAGLRLKGMYGV